MEQLRLNGRVPAGEAVAAALLRSDPLLPGHRRRTRGNSRFVPARALSFTHRAANFKAQTKAAADEYGFKASRGSLGRPRPAHRFSSSEECLMGARVPELAM